VQSLYIALNSLKENTFILGLLERIFGKRESGRESAFDNLDLGATHYRAHYMYVCVIVRKKEKKGKKKKKSSCIHLAFQHLRYNTKYNKTCQKFSLVCTLFAKRYK